MVLAVHPATRTRLCAGSGIIEDITVTFPSLQRARLDRSQAAGAPAVGDVLRACTCTTFVFPTNSLFGAQPPQRHIVCYGADQQKWTQVRLLPAVRAASQHPGFVTMHLVTLGARCCAFVAHHAFRHGRVGKSDVEQQPVCRS